MARAILEALLDSVATNVETVNVHDATEDALGGRWLRRHRCGPTLPDHAIDLLICRSAQLGELLPRLADDGLVLALAPRDEGVPETSSLVRTASVRSPEGDWQLLAQRGPTSQPTDDEQPVLSVVVTCQDQARELLRLLTVLAAQDSELPWELVVVDRGSFDETNALLRGLGGDVQLLVRERSCSREAAIDAGIRVARADTILVIGAKVVPTPDWLELAIDSVPTGPQRGLIIDGPSHRRLEPLGSPQQLDSSLDGLDLFAVSRRAYLDAGGLGGLGAPTLLERLYARLPGPALTTRASV